MAAGHCSRHEWSPVTLPGQLYGHGKQRRRMTWGCRLLPAGDDPNYWVKLTQQADADYVTRKVRKMLADINQPGSKQVGTGRMRLGAVAAGRKAGRTHHVLRQWWH